MSEYSHSIVLFTGEDGLPLEFNVRYTKDKEYLKALIEHGGGFCTHNESAVHLITDVTKAVNCNLGTQLVNSNYIIDCVKNDCLLDVNKYVLIVSESQTSDILSDEDSEKCSMPRQSTCKSPNKRPAPVINMSPIKSPKHRNETSCTTPSNLTIPSSSSTLPQASNSSSTHSESFVEGSQDVSSNYKIAYLVYHGNELSKLTSPKSKGLPIHLQTDLDSDSQSLVSPSLSKMIAHDVNSPIVVHKPLASPPLAELSYKKNDSDIVLTPPRNVSQWYNNATTIALSPIKPKNIESDILEEVPDNQDKLGFAKVSPKIKSPLKVKYAVPDCDSDDKDQSIIIPPQIQVNNNSELSHPPKIHREVLAEVHVSHTNASFIDVVSSSQPEKDNLNEYEPQLDNFDNMLLCKAQIERQPEDEESLSQSYTVSSSADAQVNSKPCSAEDNLSSSPHEKNADPLPDSPNLSLSQMNVHDYLKNLEVEVCEILQKRPPKSIQDKIMLVKYLCCVRKLPPRTVLASLMDDPSQLDV